MPLVLSGTNGVTFPDSSLQTAAASPFGLKNRIINGDFRIDQRNAGASVTCPANTLTYTLDRWAIYGDQASKFTAQRSTVASTNFTNSLLITSSSAYSVPSTEGYQIQQRIEGFNIADLNWGTANAQTVTLSFWVRSSLTGTFGGSITNSAFNRSYPFSYTISSANTFEYKTITIAGDTTGTWLTDNGIGLRLYFGLGAGSTLSGTAGSWSANGYISATGATSVVGTNGATWYVTGVQLEQNTSATPFERRLYNQELANCQRYLFAIKSSEHSDTYCRFIQGDIENSTSFTSGYTLPVRMRVTPTLTGTGTASNYGVYSAGSVTACSGNPIIASGNPQTVCVTAAVSSGLTAGRGATLLANNNNTAYLYFGAEL